jgi:hypothetical protein
MEVKIDRGMVLGVGSVNSAKGQGYLKRCRYLRCAVHVEFIVIKFKNKLIQVDINTLSVRACLYGGELLGNGEIPAVIETNSNLG